MAPPPLKKPKIADYDFPLDLSLPCGCNCAARERIDQIDADNLAYIQAQIDYVVSRGYELHPIKGFLPSDDDLPAVLAAAKLEFKPQRDALSNERALAWADTRLYDAFGVLILDELEYLQNGSVNLHRESLLFSNLKKPVSSSSEQTSLARFPAASPRKSGKKRGFSSGR